MAHTYVINTVFQFGDRIDVAGSVDGFPVQISVWQSFLQTLPDNTSKRNYVAGQMLAVAPLPGVELTQFEGTFVL